jgi:hypothetical protein
VKHKAYIGLFSLLILTYLLLNILVAPDKVTLAHYHLSLAGARAIIYSVVFPIAFIYASGAYGALMVKDYAYIIRKSKEGRAINILGNGLLLLVLFQVLTSTLGSLLALVVRHYPSWLSTLTIINNYLAIALSGLAFGVIAYGAWQLLDLVRYRVRAYEQHLMTFFFIPVFVYLVYRDSGSLSNSHLSKKSKGNYIQRLTELYSSRVNGCGFIFNYH